ncbi:hypothetical protein [Alicyclobacillus dauci]|uniref:Uncharacterized protein n=1 Tax=Alicyclobacillus dauci TaxID=1475485 RepID=A0ABY6Z005_9BACL|nr:hypothetical protein [Alicyclobacillus dauci]WAH35669.1 hypothetical protein NZD86_15485 [Alicyclobacillus dauci]
MVRAQGVPGLTFTEEPLSKRSILHAHLVLHDALDRAVKWGFVARNVADAADPPKPEPVQMSVWTRDDVLKFLEAVKSNP